MSNGLHEKQVKRAMMPKEISRVVDERLTVHGTSNLWVIDASSLCLLQKTRSSPRASHKMYECLHTRKAPSLDYDSITDI